jgi:putative transposase
MDVLRLINFKISLSPFTPLERYRHFLRATIPEGEWNLIRDAVQRGQLTGTGRFVDKVEAVLGRRIEKRTRGRPPKTERTADAQEK